MEVVKIGRKNCPMLSLFHTSKDWAERKVNFYSKKTTKKPSH